MVTLCFVCLMCVCVSVSVWCGTWCDFRFRFMLAFVCMFVSPWVTAWLPAWVRAYCVCSVIRTNPLVNLNWMSSKAKMSSHSQTVQLIGAALATHDWRVATKANRTKAETCRHAARSIQEAAAKAKQTSGRANEWAKRKSCENEARLTNFYQTLPNCQEYPLSKKRCIHMPCLLYCCTVIAQFSNSQKICYGFENHFGDNTMTNKLSLRSYSYSESEQNWNWNHFRQSSGK